MPPNEVVLVESTKVETGTICNLGNESHFKQSDSDTISCTDTIEYRSSSDTSPDPGTESLTFEIQQNKLDNTPFSHLEICDTSIVLIKPLFAEPVFTEIPYGSPASEDYMIIEPLFPEFPSVNYISDSGITSGNVMVSTCQTSDINVDNSINFIDNANDDNFIDNANDDNFIDIANDDNFIDNANDDNAVLIDSSDTDVTVLPQNISSYTHFLRFVSARSARMTSIRNKTLLSTSCAIEYPPPITSICYEEVYDFSRWTKFTAGRPKTQVFKQGKTFTYDKLPPFPQNKGKIQKHKPRRNNTKTVTTVSDHIPISVNSVLNPCAPAFNFYFSKCKC